METDVELLTDRLGEQLECLSDGKVGETVQFRYNGGHGGLRTLLILEVEPGIGAKGIDKARDGEFRHFHDSEAYDAVVVKPFVSQPEPVPPKGEEVRVRFDEAQTRLFNSIDGDKLAELYLQYVAVEGESAVYDSQAGEVVVTLPPPKIAVKNEFNTLYSSVQFSKDNRNFKLYLHQDGKLGLFLSSPNGTVTDKYGVEPDEILNGLKNFLTK